MVSSIAQSVGGFCLALIIGYCYVQAAPEGCPDVDYGQGYIYAKPEFGKCYHFVNIEKYWTEASQECRSRGGYLATISSSEIQEYIHDTFDALDDFSQNGYWIGGHDMNGEGDYMWDSGEPWSYTNWGTGEPDNTCPIFCINTDCVLMSPIEGYRWKDYPCSTTQYFYYYVCEYGWYFGNPQQPQHTTKSQGSMATRSRTDSEITDQSSKTDKSWPEKDITETTAVNTGNIQKRVDGRTDLQFPYRIAFGVLAGLVVLVLLVGALYKVVRKRGLVNGYKHPDDDRRNLHPNPTYSDHD